MTEKRKSRKILIRIIHIVLILVITLWSGYSCDKQTEEYLTYNDDDITFQYPDWPDMTPPEEEIFLLNSNGNQVFSAARYPVPVSTLKQDLEKNLGAVIEGEYAYYTLDAEGQPMESVTRLLFSDYQTYALSLMGPERPDYSLLETAEIKARELNTIEGVGIMPMPANGEFPLLSDACREGRTLGAEVLDFYFFWGWMADDWDVSDNVMPYLSYEGKSVAVMNVINTNVLGEYPPEYKSFTDPGFKEDFAAFSIEFIERYQPTYYYIGGEVDIYLSQHRDEIEPFRELLGYTYQEIKAACPETKVGLVVTYHYARDNNALDIIRTLAPEVEIIGYTVHPYLDTYSYRDISRGLEYLNEVSGVVPGKPFAIIETGWSSSELLDSSEELQAEFVPDYFSYVENGGAEYVIWFCLHDQDDCSEAVKTLLEPVPQLQEDEEYIRHFEEFMCTFGLKHSDDSPKAAWYEWQKYLE
jgi:hypothetical protein